MLDSGLLVIAGLALLGNGLVLAGLHRPGSAVLLLLPIPLSRRLVLSDVAEGISGVLNSLPRYSSQYVSWKSAAIAVATALLQLPALIVWHDRPHVFGILAGDIVLFVALTWISSALRSSMSGTVIVGLWWYFFGLNQVPGALDPAGLAPNASVVVSLAYLGVALFVAFVPLGTAQAEGARI